MTLLSGSVSSFNFIKFNLLTGFFITKDFGTSTSGCSYVDVRKNKPPVIKTIKDGWYWS